MHARITTTTARVTTLAADPRLNCRLPLWRDAFGHGPRGVDHSLAPAREGGRE